MIANQARAPRAAFALTSEGDTLAALNDARARTLALVEGLPPKELERVHSPIMSPLVWDLAHIAAYEDLWLVHRHCGAQLLHEGLAELYDAFETPRAARGTAQLLDTEKTFEYLEDVRERTAAAIETHGVGDGVVHEMVVRHELQHTETMRQTMRLAGLLPVGEPPLGPLQAPESWSFVPAGSFQMGAKAGGFSYDNERPSHVVELDAFQISAWPLRNRAWLGFCQDGGYMRREWWSKEGWQWLQDQHSAPEGQRAREGVREGQRARAGQPPEDRAPEGQRGSGRSDHRGDLDTPLCHLSWYEADALARALGARLPTEAEWERAAKLGVLEGTGLVWEWTSTRFSGYPGFQAHPYREYSEVFFDDRYQVLRGGSWATSPRVAGVTFRNWDLPERSQLFAGLRLAREER
jgi:gamma-glutamyl hercynylcysteine S-oxide synthase